MNYQQCGGVCINVFPAVLDEETGLVWERTADATSSNWIGAEHALRDIDDGPTSGLAPSHPRRTRVTRRRCRITPCRSSFLELDQFKLLELDD